MRPVTARYADPLDAIWLGVAARLGLAVRRDSSAYASTDGKGTLRIAPPEALDADDCLGQIILHEICHALVQGEHSFQQPDWGLVNDEDSAAYRGDTLREQACLRVQATLLRRHGLRGLLAPTTDFRAFYDALPADPLALPAGDPVLALCRDALGRSVRPPFAPVLEEALAATARILAVTRPLAPSPAGELPLLWRQPAPRRHSTGFPLGEDGLACGTCAWLARSGRGARCRQAMAVGQGGRVDPAGPACVLHEAALDCQACGACCRHAYDLVPLGRSEPLLRRHPELVEKDGARLRLRRAPGNRCAALGDEGPGRWACTIYEDRPRTCRDFPLGSASCLEARRRVGLSA